MEQKEGEGKEMKNLRLYGLVTTFALALNISAMLLWDFCKSLDIFEVMAFALFIALAASGCFVLASEPKKKKKRPYWVKNRFSGLYVMIK